MKISSFLSLRSAAACCAVMLSAAWPGEAGATVPQYINFQGIARQADGAPIANATVKLRFTVHFSSPSGSVAFQETQSTLTSLGGQISASIGNGTATTGSLALIDWSATTYYLQVEIDPANGNSFTNLGTQFISSVPYALQSLNAEFTSAVKGTAGRVPVFGSAGNTVGNSNIYTTSSGLVGIATATPAYTLDVVGTVRGSTVTSTGDVTAANTVQGSTVQGNVVKAGTGTFAGAITVGGLGVVRTPDANALNLTLRTLAASYTLGAGQVRTIGLGYSYTNPPQVVIAGALDGSGDVTKVVVTATNITKTQCFINFYNPGSSSLTFSATWQIMLIGN